ncbi:MAG: T9SS type A sorting domain-containing protein [Bacteroidetes bacterium]|nr:T9SS type A sorting domain-containing protein [Bacteroidota bacterium]
MGSLLLDFDWGFSVFNGTTWTKFNMANSALPGEQIYDIDLDSKGNLYINTFGQGITVYRKNQVLGFDCIDYSLQVSSPTAVSEASQPSANQIFSFPNPFTDITALEFNSITGDQITIEVYDISGKLCSSSKFISDQTGAQYRKIDLSDKPSGIYIGKISVGQTSYVVKLTKI